MFALPSITVPAAFSRATTVASYGDTKFESIFEPQVVSTPSVQKMSLWAIGMPASAGAPPACSRSSATAAAASAASRVTVTKAFSSGWLAVMRSRNPRVISTLENSRCFKPLARPASVLAWIGNALIR